MPWSIANTMQTCNDMGAMPSATCSLPRARGPRLLLSLGVFGDVIAAMNAHVNDAEVQVGACEFLSSISCAHDYYRNMVLEADGCVAVDKLHKSTRTIPA
jgi:hypothetical protein